MSGARSSDGGQVMLWVRSWIERARQSLFVLPAIIVVSSVLLALFLVAVDRRLDNDQLPDAFATSTDNARSILSVVAGGTITAASIVFSLTLVAVQLASSQFSPRILRGFLGDRFQQIVIGVVVGTFAFSLTVLREVRELGDADRAFQPQLSVLVTVVLAVVALLAVLASIDHTAKRLQVGQVLDSIADETLSTIRREFPEFGEERDGELPPSPPDQLLGDEPPPAEKRSAGAMVIESPVRGWIAQISVDAIVDAVPDGAVVVLDASVGTYVSEGTVLAVIDGVAASGDDIADEVLRERVVAAIDIGADRTMQQDVAFGLVQLTDVAVKALSSGVNDPNTALEVVARLDGIFYELCSREIPSGPTVRGGRTVQMSNVADRGDLIDLVLEPIARFGRHDPVVLASIADLVAAVGTRVRRSCERADISPLAGWVDRLDAQLPMMQCDADRAVVQAATERARRMFDSEV